MKKLALIMCSVFLTSSAMAAPKAAAPQVRSELELRLLNKTPTKIIVTGGEVISVSPQILRVTAQRFSYKRGGINGSEFGRTVLKGDARQKASVSFIKANGQAPVEITAPEIEVETALTEIQVNFHHFQGEYYGQIPYADFSEKFKAAPQSPRFTYSTSDSVLGTNYSQTAIYDRRTKNLYISFASSSMDGGFQETRKTEKNVTEEIIEQRGANSRRIEKTSE